MLIIKFQVGSQTYAVDADRIVEVIPCVELRAVAHAPEYLKGLFNYRGRVIPVVDVGMLLGAPPCQARLSTRILIVRPGADAHGQPALGLLAERMTDLRTVPEGEWLPNPLELPSAPFLGPVSKGENGLIQLILVDRVAPDLLSSIAQVS
jgi:chemotaxis-related protein WspB